MSHPESITLSAEDITVGYPSGPNVVHDVDLSLAQGEIVTLLGPNGAGKSTLLAALLGELVPRVGRVSLAGRDLAAYSARDHARLVGHVPQNDPPVYDYRVDELVLMGRAPYIPAYGRPMATDRRAARDAMETLGIIHLAERNVHQLSGGERQLVLFARLMAQDPALVLLDEPASALDMGHQAAMLELVRGLARRGYGILMTTHNPDHALLLGGRSALLGRDGILKVGSADEIVTEPALQALYGDSVHVTDVPQLNRRVCTIGLPLPPST